MSSKLDPIRLELRMVEIDRVEFDRRQPRQDFDDKSEAGLAASIENETLVQPIIVKPDPEKEGHFILVAGERRIRACSRLGEKEIQAIVRHGDKRDTFIVSLIENLHRKNLNEIEEALAIKRLVEEYAMPFEAIGKLIMNMSVPTLKLRLKLLDLPPEVQRDIRNGKLGLGVALNLAQFKGRHGAQLRAARELIAGNPKGLLMLERIGSLGDERVEARLPSDPVGLMKRIIKARSSTRSTGPAIQRFVGLSPDLQQTTWSTVAPEMRKAIISHYTRLEKHISTFLETAERLEAHALKQSKMTEKEPAPEQTHSAPIDDEIITSLARVHVAEQAEKKAILTGSPKRTYATPPNYNIMRRLLVLMFYKYGEVPRRQARQIRLSVSYLRQYTDMKNNPVQVTNAALRALELLKEHWGQATTPDQRPEKREFILLCNSLVRDYDFAPSFEQFIRGVSLKDHSQDPLDLSSFLPEKQQKAV